MSRSITESEQNPRDPENWADRLETEIKGSVVSLGKENLLKAISTEDLPDEFVSKIKLAEKMVVAFPVIVGITVGSIAKNTAELLGVQYELQHAIQFLAFILSVYFVSAKLSKVTEEEFESMEQPVKSHPSLFVNQQVDRAFALTLLSKLKRIVDVTSPDGDVNR